MSALWNLIDVDSASDLLPVFAGLLPISEVVDYGLGLINDYVLTML